MEQPITFLAMENRHVPFLLHSRHCNRINVAYGKSQSERRSCKPRQYKRNNHLELAEKIKEITRSKSAIEFLIHYLKTTQKGDAQH